MAGYFLKNDFTPSTSSTYTVSFWIKINNFLPTSINVPYCWSIGQQGQQTSGLFFQGDTTPYCIGFYNGANGTRYMPTNYMRDTNAWYHVHLKVSSGTGTLYYNGESVKTSIVVPAQNSGGYGNTHAVHTYVNDPAGYDNLECVMSHFHFVDGTAYDPTVFGSTDSTTGEWKINTSPSVTYGTNGYFILKDGNTGTDQSSNTNNFTLTGTCTKTEDCPSNVFATLNPLHKSLNTSRSFHMGNNYVVLGGTARVPEVSTLGMTSGKFYAEVKDVSGSGGNSIMGITGKMYRSNANYYLGHQSDDYSYAATGNKINNSNETSFGNTYTDGDIIGIAVDLDNLKIYFSKNGTWQNSGDPTSGSTGTGAAFTLTAPSSTNDGAYFFACSDDNVSAERRMGWNFGNGYFQTTAVSSAGTNASGIGIFEYDVPTGYTALSTKGLNE